MGFDHADRYFGQLARGPRQGWWNYCQADRRSCATHDVANDPVFDSSKVVGDCAELANDFSSTLFNHRAGLSELSGAAIQQCDTKFVFEAGDMGGHV